MFDDHFDTEDVTTRARTRWVSPSSAVTPTTNQRTRGSRTAGLLRREPHRARIRGGRAKALELEPGTEVPTEVWEPLVETRLRDVDVDPGAGPNGLPDVHTRSDDRTPVSRRPGSLVLPSSLAK